MSNDNIANSVLRSEFNFIHQNIRSMRSNFDLLLANLSSISKSPKLIFLTEVWVDSCELPNYNIADYKIFGNCNSDYRAGGVVVYTHKSIQCNLIYHKAKSADILQVNTNINSEVVSFLCIYRLHSISADTFVDELKVILEGIHIRNLFVVGDINIDILNFPAHANNYLFLMSSCGLESLVNEPTRITNSSLTCLDHVFYRSSSTSKCSIEVCVHNYRITDHCTILGNISDNTPKHANASIRSNNDHKKINYDSLSSALNNERWISVFNEDDASVAYEQFMSILSNYVEANSFQINETRSNNIRMLKPWITSALCKEIKLKNRLSRKLRKHPTNTNLKEQVENLTKLSKEKVKNAKSSYYLNKFNECGGNMKKSWQLVNEVLSNERNSSEVDAIIDCNNVLVSDKTKLPDIFNEHFTNVSCNIGSANRISDESFIGKQSDRNSFFFAPVTVNEMLNTIDSLKTNCSPGHDKLSNILLKKIAIYIVDVLVYIFNLSFSTGKVPLALKTAIVIPIFKKGDRNILGNYRPISLLPAISKILEKLVKKRILIFLNQKNFFHESQFGFREKRGTEIALLEFLNSVHKGMDVGNSVVSIFVDIVKAFDMVDHQLLMKKLHLCGFRGVSYTWFESYLSERYQYVRLNGNVSCTRLVNVGVPQGSVIGPILFLIYINSVFSLKVHCSMFAFADDMALLYTYPSEIICLSKIQEDLRLLAIWFNVHRMVLSSKTKAMIFNSTNAGSPSLDITYHSTNCTNYCNEDCIIINCVDTFKYLGLLLDCKVNWKPLIANIRNYMLFAIRKFYMLRLTCPTSVLRCVYFALIQSKLSYGITCWGGTYASNLIPIVLAQKYSLRVIHKKSRYTSSWPLFKLTNVLPVRHLYVFRALRIFFKISGNWTNHIPAYHLRTRNRYNIQKFCTTHFRNSFLILAPSIFNRLPENLRIITIANEFTSQLRIFLHHCEDISYLFEFIS